MIKTARQLKDLIRNLSKDKSADAQILMRNYMMERFLERISLSEYRDKFILKGGMLVAAMVGLDARSTMDIDATVKGATVGIEEVENMIASIISVPVDDGVEFRVKRISEIMDEAEYPGIRVSMETEFDGVITPLKIDISTGDAITPREVRYSFKLMLEDRSIEIWAYNLETVLAEKLETVVSRATTNTRMRDFYDLHILGQLHGQSIVPADLRAALIATAKKRGTEKYLADAPAAFDEVEADPNIQSFTREQFCSLSDETRIQYGLRTVYPEREAAKYQLKPAHKSNDGLSVSNLSFAYKKGPDVLRNINFEAHKGDVIGILGHNGAGKTTLLSIMTGLLKEKTGSIRYNGKKLSPRQRRNLSYLVMQDTDYQLFGSSVEEELSLGIENDCSGKVTETLEALELGAYRECHPASLSGGQKQRVTIGAAIVKDSPVIYFDEPTSGLDYDSMVRVSHLIEQLAAAGVIIFIVSHDFEFITRTCSEVLQLDGQDSIKNQVLTPEILLSLSKQYFN